MKHYQFVLVRQSYVSLTPTEICISSDAYRVASESILSKYLYLITAFLFEGIVSMFSVKVWKSCEMYFRANTHGMLFLGAGAFYYRHNHYIYNKMWNYGSDRQYRIRRKVFKIQFL